MKILGVQNFALMMATVTVMVYPAPLSPHSCKDRLLQIKTWANNNEKHVPLDKQVARTPRSHGIICVKQFFCWAEKILNETQRHLSGNHNLKGLTRSVHVYNEEFQDKNISCPLDTDVEYELGSFLEDIKWCVNYTITSNHCKT